MAECDDGNNNAGDGCSADCKAEAGFKCKGGSPTAPDVCTVFNFVKDKADTVLDPAAKNAAVELLPDKTLDSRQMWKKVQSNCTACFIAASHLSTGKKPSTRIMGKVQCAITDNGKQATIAKD